MKPWKRDLAYIREVGPDEPRFDAAVQRVWDRCEEMEKHDPSPGRNAVPSGSSVSPVPGGIRPTVAYPPPADPRLMSHTTRDRGSHHIEPGCCAENKDKS